MAVYKAFASDNEVVGGGILASVNAFGYIDIQDHLEKHGLKDIEPEGWYSQQAYLDLMRELDETKHFNLVAIGMKIPDSVPFPPEIDNIEKALASLGHAYAMNNRGSDIGYYRFESLGEGHGKLYCKNPYPSDFDYGIIYRLIQKFRATGQSFTVRRDDSIPNRKTGADECVYEVEWVV